MVTIAIVDYGLGNLFSVLHACRAVGLSAALATDADSILGADAVVVPGVGAFGEAMRMLRQLDLVAPLQDVAAAGVPLIGICLGMQLLMTESEEFGEHRGLGLLEGPVVKFPDRTARGGSLRVPHIGWNRILRPNTARTEPQAESPGAGQWSAWPLKGIQDGEFMYFVHSYCAEPEDATVVLTRSHYEGFGFASSVIRGNVFGCQFHPERSGPAGLAIYHNIARHILAVLPTRRRAGV